VPSAGGGKQAAKFGGGKQSAKLGVKKHAGGDDYAASIGYGTETLTNTGLFHGKAIGYPLAANLQEHLNNSLHDHAN